MLLNKDELILQRIEATIDELEMAQGSGHRAKSKRNGAWSTGLISVVERSRDHPNAGFRAQWIYDLQLTNYEWGG